MLTLPRSLYDEIVGHALECVPRECCGIVSLNYARFQRVYQCGNVADDPKREYRVDADDQLYAIRDIADRGEIVGAIYHSHPVGPPVLSAMDIKLATTPAFYWVLGLEMGRPRLGMFRVLGQVQAMDVSRRIEVV